MIYPAKGIETMRKAANIATSPIFPGTLGGESKEQKSETTVADTAIKMVAAARDKRVRIFIGAPCPQGTKVLAYANFPLIIPLRLQATFAHHVFDEVSRFLFLRVLLFSLFLSRRGL